MLIQAILPGDYLIWVQEKLKDKEYPVVQSPLKEDPALSAVAMRRAPPVV